MKFYEIDGIRFHVDVCGDGFPLVLLHGFTGDSTTWSSFKPTWGKDSKLIMPDLIGHGKTDSPVDVKHYSIQAAARHLAILLDQLQVEKVDLLGYSMGGRLALTFALLYPDRMRKLILESSTAGLETKEEKEQRRKQDHQLADDIEKKGIETFVSYWEKIPLFQTQQSLPEETKQLIRTQRLANSTIGLANSLRGMGTGAQPSWWDHLVNLDIPVLFITGTLDEKFCRLADLMCRKVKKSQIVKVIGCGHAIHVEEPKKFDKIVSEFLKNT